MLAEAFLLLAALYVLLAVTLAFYIAHRIAYPPWHKPNPGGAAHSSASLPDSWHSALTPSDLRLPYKAICIPTTRGTLRAWLIPTPTLSTTAVACVHGAGRDRRAFLRHAAFLSRAGCDVLLFDCLNHGLSDAVVPSSVALGAREAADVTAAAAFLRARGARHVVALGTSQGAAAALIAAANGAALDLLLLENPFVSPSRLVRGVAAFVLRKLPVPGYSIMLPFVIERLALWRTGNSGHAKCTTAEGVVGQVHVPLFFVHGTADVIVHWKQSEELFHMVKHERKELWLVEGGSHTHCHFKEPEIFEEKVLAFLRKHLGEDALSKPPSASMLDTE